MSYILVRNFLIIQKDKTHYTTVNTCYRGERTGLSVNGTLAAVASSDYGAQYFSTDLLGSVKTTTDSLGTQKASYTYDAFGTLVEGDLSGTKDYGYLGKQHDPTANLYNYGYRDYSPSHARFTTVDPIRDGTNWFSYCNGDPVNFVDLWGLEAGDKPNLIRPAEGDITSEFGVRDPLNTKNGKTTSTNHGGIDIANEEGTDITAAGDGVVLDKPKSETESPYGNYVIIDNDGKGWASYTLYAHLKEPSPLKVGDNVKQGDSVGKMGETGNSTGPHLHFEVRINGEKKDPRDYIEF